MKLLLVTAIAFGSLAIPVSAQMATPQPSASPMATPSAFPLSKLPMPMCQSGDPIVLVDPNAKVYYVKAYYAKGSVHGTPPKDSGYMCESAAVSGGIQAAKTTSS